MFLIRFVTTYIHAYTIQIFNTHFQIKENSCKSCDKDKKKNTIKKAECEDNT